MQTESLTDLLLDEEFGVGGWRPMKRFAIEQAGGKVRVIDDACRSGHNEATKMCETIFTTSSDFPILATMLVLQEILKVEYPGIDLSKPGDELCKLVPEWADMRMMLQDMADAYR